MPLFIFHLPNNINSNNNLSVHIFFISLTTVQLKISIKIGSKKNVANLNQLRFAFYTFLGSGCIQGSR